MMKNFLFYVSLVLMVIILSCNSTKKIAATNKGDNEIIFMRQWKPSEVLGLSVPGNTKAQLAFTPGEKNMLTGSTGCNRVNGTFVLSGDHQLKLSPLATTRMACMDETAATIENKLLDALHRATGWWADSTQLLLKNGDTILAKFRAVKAFTNEQEKLSGTWELNFITGSEQSFETLYPEKKPTLIFALPGLQVGGTSSCNGYGTEVKIDGSNISFNDPVSTMMACPGNGEQLFFKTLKSITAFKVEADHSLTLLAGNIPAMHFTKK